MALLNALFLVAILTILMVAGIRFLDSTTKVASQGNYDAEAYNMARAGLMDTLAWFRRQPTQPVTSFGPTPAPSPGDPGSGDTDDPESIDPASGAGEPNLGIVREYSLDSSSNLWGRYEVGKITRLQRDAKGHYSQYEVLQGASDDQLTPVSLANASSTQYEGVRDVSTNEGVSTAGTVWRLRSQGYVYVQNAPGSYFFQWPNKVLGQVDLETEIRRLQFKDYGAALTINGCGNVTCTDDNHVTLDGGSGGNDCIQGGAGTPNPDPSNSHTNTVYNGPVNSAYDTSQISWSNAFGVPDSMTLEGLADIRATKVSDLPANLPASAVVYIKPVGGSITFDGTHPLSGGGVLVVDGSLTIAQSSTYQSWTGMIYVNGNYVQGGNTDVTGEVVVTGNASFLTSSGGGGGHGSHGGSHGGPGGYHGGGPGGGHSSTPTVTLTYDNGTVTSICNQLENYRESRAALKVINN
ncbi:MAG TPA: hypothetical protein V6D47_20460 [Oscillatoriaceae cyanobacterium]